MNISIKVLKSAFGTLKVLNNYIRLVERFEVMDGLLKRQRCEVCILFDLHR